MAKLVSHNQKYQKPQARDFVGLNAAEGFCSGGAHAYGKTCTNGPDTTDPRGGHCAPGGSADFNPPLEICFNGATAANCYAMGINAGG